MSDPPTLDVPAGPVDTLREVRDELWRRRLGSGVGMRLRGCAVVHASPVSIPRPAADDDLSQAA
jgi:hypothetical protein